jgi:hypothetical protein
MDERSGWAAHGQILRLDILSLSDTLFLRGESFPRFSYAVTFLRVDIASKGKKVVYRMSEILFAAEIAFRSLDGCMPSKN